MINNERIVPITAVDLISMYGLILKNSAWQPPINGKIDADNTNGDFTQSTNGAPAIASEPVKSFNFASGVTSYSVYFVPAYDYTGFQINGTAVTTTGDTVNADGRTLYKATLSSGEITIAKIGL